MEKFQHYEIGIPSAVWKWCKFSATLAHTAFPFSFNYMYV